MKFFGLVERVGAGGGIDDEKREVWCVGILLGDGAADFSKLFHEVVAGVDAAGGVTDEKIGLFFDGTFVGIEADGRWVGLCLSGDDGDVEAVTPALELLDGGGAECIGGGEEYGVALVFQPHAKLGGRGGFTSAIDTDDKNNSRLAVSLRRGWGVVFGKDFRKALVSDFNHVVGGNFSAEIVEFIDDAHTEFRSKIGSDEIRLEFIPIDLCLVGDAVENLFEEACHVGGRLMRVRKL